jgi:prephenate dehydratase
MAATDSADTPGPNGTPIRVGYQGVPGAFSEEAALEVCGANAVLVPFRENREVTAALAQGTIDRAVLPVENTIAGAVVPTCDAIIGEPDVHAVGELILPIHHYVLGCPGSTLAALRTIESHPVALAQCRNFLDLHPNLEARAAFDTAGAARDIAAAGDITRGAIAGRRAAQHYGLQILAEHVEDRHDNQTRFLALSRTPAAPTNGPARTFMVITGDNVPGTLLKILQPLAARGLNLSSLSSRPAGVPWMYYFLLEFEHEGGDPAIAEASLEIEKAARSVRVVGTYKLGVD